MKPTIHATVRNPQPTLFLAFELSDQDWKLGFTIGLGWSRSPGDRRSWAYTVPGV